MSRLFLETLRQIFHFDAWHASGTYACRPYKEKAVTLAGSIKPALALEVGCGLGEIIRRVPAGRRIGVDPDPDVLRAARFLANRRAEYRQASFSEPDRIAAAAGGQPIDVLIAINWVHHLSTAQIESGIDAIQRCVPVRYLLIDEVAATDLVHRHDRSTLAGLGEVETSVHDEHDARTLHLVRLRQSPGNPEPASHANTIAC
jgi:hypothetical protein